MVECEGWKLHGSFPFETFMGDGWLLSMDWLVEVNRRMEGESEWFDWRRYVVDGWGYVEWGWLLLGNGFEILKKSMWCE